MKTIYLVRHAKSSWEDSSLSDFDRPLNKRGKNDAPLMANTIKEKISIPDLIFSSPAKRAFTTALQFAETFGLNSKDIISDMKIYEAGVSDIMRIINNVSDELDSIMIFGHNPTFTMLSNYITSKHIDNIPTCGCVQIDCNCDSWDDITGNSGKLVLFEYPRKYQK